MPTDPAPDVRSTIATNPLSTYSHIIMKTTIYSISDRPSRYGMPCLDQEDLVDYDDALQSDVLVCETDISFLRNFILEVALYVEQLELLCNEYSEDFWQAREHAYHIVTTLLREYFEYEMEFAAD
jgi:hypothetical protein